MVTTNMVIATVTDMVSNVWACKKVIKAKFLK